jgi:hypothetical protein
MADDDLRSPGPRISLTKRGLLAPLQRDQKNDFANGSGAALQAANIRQAIGTQAATDTAPGAVAWDGTLGSRVHLVVHRNGTANQDEILRHFILDAIRVAEPSARVTRVVFDRTKERTLVKVRFIPTDGNGRAIGDEQTAEVPLTES